MVNTKTTAVRLIPAPGKDVGDRVEFGGLLGSAPVMPVHVESAADSSAGAPDPGAHAEPQKLKPARTAAACRRTGTRPGFSGKPGLACATEAAGT